MPSQDPPLGADTTSTEATSTAQNLPQENGEVKKGAKAQESTEPVDGAKLTGAEAKKQAKAEKAARRAQAIQQKAGAVPPAVSEPVSVPEAETTAPKNETPKPLKVQSQHKRGPSVSVGVKGIPARRKVAPVPEVAKEEDKTVEFFRHLNKPRTTTIAGVNKEVHPAVLALGLQMSNYTICGSCARLVATLQALKRVGVSKEDQVYQTR